jgi:hypothetical protein
MLHSRTPSILAPNGDRLPLHLVNRLWHLPLARTTDHADASFPKVYLIRSQRPVRGILRPPRPYQIHQHVSFADDSECVYSPLDPPNSVRPLAHTCAASSRSHVASATSASFNEFRLLRFSAAQEGSRRVTSSVSSGPAQRIPLRERHNRHVAPLLQLWRTLAARGLRRQYLAAGFAQHSHGSQVPCLCCNHRASVFLASGSRQAPHNQRPLLDSELSVIQTLHNKWGHPSNSKFLRIFQFYRRRGVVFRVNF